MNVLYHHIYEYKKGLRSLVLHTLPSEEEQNIVRKLKNRKIPYIIRRVTEKKINIFFGAPECIAVVKQFGEINLNEFTPEQDFILGIMLGYGRLQQCNRYLKMVDEN